MCVRVLAKYTNPRSNKLSKKKMKKKLIPDNRIRWDRQRWYEIEKETNYTDVWKFLPINFFYSRGLVNCLSPCIIAMLSRYKFIIIPIEVPLSGNILGYFHPRCRSNFEFTLEKTKRIFLYMIYVRNVRNLVHEVLSSSFVQEILSYRATRYARFLVQSELLKNNTEIFYENLCRRIRKK